MIVPADENRQHTILQRFVVFGLQVDQQVESVCTFDPVARRIDRIAVNDIFPILFGNVSRFIRYMIRITALAHRTENVPHLLDPHVLGLYTAE